MTTCCCGKITVRTDHDPKTSTAGKIAKWLAIALVVGGLFFGVSGLLVYIKQLIINFGPNGVTLSVNHGFYAMVGGFTALTLAIVLGSINVIMKRCSFTKNPEAQKNE